MAWVIGWDLGGANLKLACIEGGEVRDAAQVPCPIRQDCSKFDLALAHAFSLCPPGAVHAVTMTGELSDVFSDRVEGVAYLVEMMRNATNGEALFYAGRLGFLDCIRATESAHDVASANWHASAAFVAQSMSEALFIDVGTTTTDLIPLKGGEVAARGFTDGERLTERELIYSGAVRTPAMAMARSVPFRGRMQGVAAERFATMADVWRLLGELPANADPYPTPDLKGKTTQESAVRLARMLGRDLADAGLLAVTDAARYFAACQIAEIEAAAHHLCTREDLGAEAPVVGAGCGRFIAKHVANRLGRPYCDFIEIIACDASTGEIAAVCAPAVAVGLLVESEVLLPSAQSAAH
ncbi:MAG TPA: hydantoinase/oxoprolinase family protein [Methyloceanibacter sp.]|nr:hydantoinase/oxoprolinase family protein [Methyloceanibacter sp.]